MPQLKEADEIKPFAGGNTGSFLAIVRIIIPIHLVCA